jgi:hypothetical protein
VFFPEGFSFENRFRHAFSIVSVSGAAKMNKNFAGRKHCCSLGSICKYCKFLQRGFVFGRDDSVHRVDVLLKHVRDFIVFSFVSVFSVNHHQTVGVRLEFAVVF